MNAQDYVKLPPALYAEAWDGLTVDDQTHLAHDLSIAAQTTATAAAYADARDLGLSHDDAAKSANRVLIALRRALGYAYPESGAVPF